MAPSPLCVAWRGAYFSTPHSMPSLDRIATEFSLEARRASACGGLGAARHITRGGRRGVNPRSGAPPPPPPGAPGCPVSVAGLDCQLDFLVARLCVAPQAGK
eukprot:gene23906-biopygen7349